METKVKTADNGIDNKTANRNNGNGQRANNLPLSTAFNESKEEPKKEETAKPTAETSKAEPGRPGTAAAQEPSKKEQKEQFAAQQARKLEETEKIVEQLGKKIAQKKKLQSTITNLDEFVLAQNEQDDLAGDSRFLRCELSITDDEGREFSTKNPFIIAYVAHEVKQLCIDKLGEVEAAIIIPQ